MKLFARLVFAAGLIYAVPAFSQKLKKSDKLVIGNLKAHVSYLADDKLEGRRAGSNGEKMASSYISKQFEAIGLEPKGDGNGWLQAFPILDGKGYRDESYLFINGHEIGKDHFFPSALSPEKMLEAMPSIALKETGVPWFIDLAEELEANKSNPHFDAASTITDKAKDAASKGATALIVYNNSTLKYEPRQKGETLPIPVIYLDSAESARYCSDETAMLEVKLRTAFKKLERTGHNVVGYINNGAPYTVLLGAHYDHLGYGEDGNSMLRTGEKLIHNGADDNASGTAALIELARALKKEKAKKANYLFIAFSGEELGLFGSKFFAENATVPLSSVTYMINMDMVGRLSDSSRTLTVGGYGTSPAWGAAFSSLSDNKFIRIKFDSSGTGPSDHSTFYRRDIPVLFFFTGLHTDYHKPGDDAGKINYEGQYRIVQLIRQVVARTGTENKLVFTKTREQQTTTNARFTVTMGIMPDYSYGGNGVRVDGVTEGRPARKAGLQAGDIILKLGDYPTPSVEEYMQALTKFRKGDKTSVTYKRADTELSAAVEF